MKRIIGNVIGCVALGVILWVGFYGCFQAFRALTPIECKKCVNCGWTVRWQGGLPGQFGGPCPKCGGFMGDCE